MALIERLKANYKYTMRPPHPRRGQYLYPYTFWMSHEEAAAEGVLDHFALVVTRG